MGIINPRSARLLANGVDCAIPGKSFGAYTRIGCDIVSANTGNSVGAMGNPNTEMRVNFSWYIPSAANERSLK